MGEFMKVLPYYISDYVVKNTKLFKRVDMWSSVDSRSRMPAKHERFYVLKTLNFIDDQEIFCWTLYKKRAQSLRTYYHGTVLVQEARLLKDKFDLAKLNQQIKNEFGDNWTYKDSYAQNKVADILGIRLPSAASNFDLLADSYQLRVNE